MTITTTDNDDIKPIPGEQISEVTTTTNNNEETMMSNVNLGPAAIGDVDSPPSNFIAGGESSLPSAEELKIDSAIRSSSNATTSSYIGSSGGNGGNGDYASSSGKKKMILIGVFVLIILGIIIGVSVGVSSKNKKSSSDGGEPRKHSYDEVNDFLDTIVSNPSLLEDDSTPQAKAAYWITHTDKANMALPNALEETDPIDSNNDNFDNKKQKYIQRYAMATFFYSTNGDTDWLTDLNFMSADDVCQWYKLFYLKNKDNPDQQVEYQIGVECNEVTNLITKIFIPGNKMSGILPPELGLLTSLVHISLYDNDIAGELPYELQKLTELDYLALHRNDMSGQIPDWLSKLQYLRVLGLGNNNFKSSIPDSFGTMISLAELSLDDNELFGDIKVFNTLTNLKHLYLEDNYFEGEFDTTTLSKLDSLETLDLSDNNFTGVIPEHLFYLYNLRVLDLHDNYFTGDLPTFDEQNDVLKFMALHSNLIEGEIPDGINNFISLNHLDLSLNEFTGNITDSLGDLEDLKYLFLSDNDFDEGPIPDFLYYDDLVELSLKSTNRVGEIPDWFGDFDETLLFLDLSENELEGSIPERLTELTGLAFLLLHENFLTGQVPDAIRDMKTLGMLTINQNFIEDDLDGKVCDGDTITVGQGQVMISDCGGDDPYVTCDCCTECCDHDADEDGGGDHDHDEDTCDVTEYVPANLDPYWESKYQRNVFVFDEDIQFYIQQTSNNNNN